MAPFLVASGLILESSCFSPSWMPWMIRILQWLPKCLCHMVFTFLDLSKIMPSCSWFQMSIVGGLPNQHVTLQFGVFNDVSAGVSRPYSFIRIKAFMSCCGALRRCGLNSSSHETWCFQKCIETSQFDGLGMSWSSLYSYTDTLFIFIHLMMC